MMKTRSASVRLQPALRKSARIVAATAVMLVVVAGFMVLGSGPVPAYAAVDRSARPAPTPLTRDAAAALVGRLKESLAEAIESEDEINAITAKWDRRQLAGKTREQILDLLFADLRAVVTAKETQDSIWESWQNIGAEEEPTEPEEPVKPSPPSKPAEPAKPSTPAKPAEPVRRIDPAPAPSGPGDELRIVLKPGQKFRAESTVDVNSSSEVMGQTMETVAKTSNVTVYEIRNVSSGGIDLTATITKMVVNTSTLGQEMSFDSEDKGSSGPMADMLKPRMNKPRSITLNDKGTIVKQDETEEAGKQSGMLGLSDSHSTSTDLFIPALVGRNLKAGDSFDDVSSSKKDKYSSRDSGTYTIKSIENGIANISYTGKQEVTATTEQMGMEMATKSTNNVKSEYRVDVKTGIVLTKSTVIEMVISIDTGGMTIPSTGKTVMSVRITPL